MAKVCSIRELGGESIAGPGWIKMVEFLLDNLWVKLMIVHRVRLVMREKVIVMCWTKGL